MPRFNRKRSVARTKPSRAKSDVVFEPQRGDLTKPRPTAWVNKTPINPRSPEGAIYLIPQTNLHHGDTEENRRILRAIGCEGGRTPLLIKERDGASAPGVVTEFGRGRRHAAGGGYRTLIPNPKSLVGAAEAMMS